MFRYVIRRVLAAIPVMLIVSAAVFTLLYLTPGDPAYVILGPDARPEQIEELRERLGLNESWYVQLARWYGRLAQGDLGTSLFLNQPVGQAIRKGQSRYDPFPPSSGRRRGEGSNVAKLQFSPARRSRRTSRRDSAYP